MNPYKHALIDEKKYNLKVEDTLPIHTFMDSSKLVIGTNQHRVFFHHSYMPYIAHKIFGYSIKNKYDQDISIKDIIEQSHILPDFKNKFIPTLSDYFKDFNLKFLYLKELFNINLGVNYFPHIHSNADECVSVEIL